MTSPVYAAFRATVHIIDHVKKSALGRLLMESVASTAPGETLDEKLAALTFPRSNDREPCDSDHPAYLYRKRTTVPPPSSETEAWWDTPGKPSFSHPTLTTLTSRNSNIDHPNGVVPASADIDLSVPQRGNPFDSPLDSPLSASPSSSDEELFNHALALQTPMVPSKKPPPPPPPKRQKAGDS